MVPADHPHGTVIGIKAWPVHCVETGQKGVDGDHNHEDVQCLLEPCYMFGSWKSINSV